MSRRFATPFCIRLSALLPVLAWGGLAGAAGQIESSPIQIRVVEGDGAINSIRLHRAHDPVVQVVNRAGNPVMNATVTFLLPPTGPSGTFLDHGLSLTVQSDSRGLAAARGLRPNGTAGPFRIRVTASWEGEPASVTLTETNAEPVAKSGHSKKIVILAVIGGAAAAGIAAAAAGGKSSAAPTAAGATPSGSSGGATIVAGSPSLGPPH